VTGAGLGAIASAAGPAGALEAADQRCRVGGVALGDGGDVLEDAVVLVHGLVGGSTHQTIDVTQFFLEPQARCGTFAIASW
jgi:hypothetical protein